MSADKLLEALGATDEMEALRLMAEINQFLTDIKGATGRDTFAGSLQVLRASIGLSRDIEKTTEKPGAEAHGVVLAWKSAFERLPSVEARVIELEESVRTKDVAALIAQALQKPGAGASEHAGKLTPATAEYFKTRTVEELRGFLAVAPRVMPVIDHQPAGDPKAGAAASSAAAAAYGTKKYEDIGPSERAALNDSDPLLYAALRNDWIERGEPASDYAQMRSPGDSPLNLGGGTH